MPDLPTPFIALLHCLARLKGDLPEKLRAEQELPGDLQPVEDKILTLVDRQKKDVAAAVFANHQEEKAQLIKNYEEAFRAMEQRALQAEAKLLEYLPGVHFGRDER